MQEDMILHLTPVMEIVLLADIQNILDMEQYKIMEWDIEIILIMEVTALLDLQVLHILLSEQLSSEIMDKLIL